MIKKVIKSALAFIVVVSLAVMAPSYLAKAVDNSASLIDISK
jgi:hypothetical protein